MSDQYYDVDIDTAQILAQLPVDLNSYDTLGEGFEKVINKVGFSCSKIKKQISKVFYGKTNLAQTNRTTGARRTFQNPLQLGLIRVLNSIASIDFCAIFSFAANQIPDNLQKFDPTKQPEDQTPLGRRKWQIQKNAYDVQVIIDKFMSVYAGSNTALSLVPKNSQTQRALKSLISEVTSILEDLNDVNSSASLVNPEFSQTYPQSTILSNFITNAIGSLNRKIDLRQFTNDDFNSIIDTINKVRQICITVQAINDPKSALQQIDTFTKGAISQQIRQLDNIIDPSKAVPLLKSIIQGVKVIINIARQIASFISLFQVIIRISLLLIKIFYKLRKFFFGVPIPQVVNTVGVQTAISATYEDIIVNKGLTFFLRRLLQINELLSIIKGLCLYIINQVVVIIPKLELISRNLSSCDQCPEELKQDYIDTIQQLKDAQKVLQDFVDTTNNATTLKSRSYGDYIIQIVTEETTDTVLSIKRRFGIALDRNKIKVVQSTPTFASDDNIIVNEVKLLLSAGGFVNKSLTGIDPSDLTIIIESLNNLENTDITIDDIDISSISISDLDPPNNENENIGLGLNAFVNKLPGGKALRKRMRKAMANQAQNLSTDLKSTDPNRKYTSNIVPTQN